MKIIRLLLLAVVLMFRSGEAWSQGPYAPPAGQAGSTAIAADSAVFSSWAIHSEVSRGPMNIANPGAGNASVGDELSSTGSPGENGILSLGDGGSVVLTFGEPIRNIPGPDFAVFENSFSHDFLELAFVEVSSDGIHFVRFDAVSLTDTATQLASFGSLDATNLYNFAGKYKGGFGTPFDLEELTGHVHLDVNHVTHVKVIDVVGNIDPLYRTADAQGRPVNDPWPTEFASGGFDLDAVGILSPGPVGWEETGKRTVFSFYPNPAYDRLSLRWEKEAATVEITDLRGRVLWTRSLDPAMKKMNISLPGEGFQPGYYMVHYRGVSQQFTRMLLVTGN